MTILRLCIAFALCAAVCDAQAPKPPATAHSHQEFPLMLQQRIVAGQTAVGTTVEGRLVIATLIRGVVIPAGAVFSGKVEESVAKAKDAPSRLTVHMVSARWERKSLAVDLYATNAYYSYPKQDNSTYEQPSPNDDPPPSPGAYSGLATSLEQVTAVVRNRRQRPDPQIKYPQRSVAENVKVESENGALVLTSTKTNIRLDRDGMYSFEGNIPAKITAEQPKR